MRVGLEGAAGVEINTRAWRDLFFSGTRWQAMPISSTAYRAALLG